jgi:hypothetical protein
VRQFYCSLSFHCVTGQNIFIHQQDVELTVPVTIGSSYSFDIIPLMQIKFTDIQSTSSSTYKFSLKGPPDFLSIDEASGEIYFVSEKWFKQEQVKHLEAVVRNTDNELTASTMLTFNFVTMDKNKFCLEHLCFYDKIRFMTTEFNNNKKDIDQIIDDIIPISYRSFCDTMKSIYSFDHGKLVTASAQLLIKIETCLFIQEPNTLRCQTRIKSRN